MISARFANAASAMGAGLVHSLFMGLAFPPFGLWGFTFIAPLPLIALAVRRARAHLLWTPLLAGLGTTMVWAWVMQWVIPVSPPGYPPLLTALGLYNALFVALVMVWGRRWPAWPVWLVGPAVWTGVEFLRGEVAFDGFPWLLLAHPLIDAPGAASPASSLGTYFVSFLAATAGCAAAATLAGRLVFGRAEPRRSQYRAIAWCLVLAAGATAAGALGQRGIRDGREIRIAVVQTNVPQDNKLGWSPKRRLADWERMAEMTRSAAAASPPPDMIIWPETMFPGEFLDGPSVEAQRRSGLGIRYTDDEGRGRLLMLTEFVDRLLALQAEVEIPLVVGAMAADNLRFVEFGGPGGGTQVEFDRRYNSAFVVAGGRVLDDRYDKLALTPFGEVMPYISNWAWLERQLLALGAHGMAFDLSPGRGPATLAVPIASDPVRLAAPICFESAMSGVVRALVRSAGPDGAGAIVNLTNDGWFAWFDGGRAQHLQIARWRAVELGRPVVRSANTGVSCLIDRWGRVSGAAAPRIEAVVAGPVRLAEGRTIYGRVGNVFGWSVLAVTAALSVAGAWGEYRSRKTGSGGTGDADGQTGGA